MHSYGSNGTTSQGYSGFQNQDDSEQEIDLLKLFNLLLVGGPLEQHIDADLE